MTRNRAIKLAMSTVPGSQRRDVEEIFRKAKKHHGPNNEKALKAMLEQSAILSACLAAATHYGMDVDIHETPKQLLEISQRTQQLLARLNKKGVRA